MLHLTYLVYFSFLFLTSMSLPRQVIGSVVCWKVLECCTSLKVFEIVLLMFEQVKAVVQDKREEHVLDSSLENCPEEEINNVFNIALMCLEPEPSRRPTMAEVVKMLEKIKSDTVVTDC